MRTFAGAALLLSFAYGIGADTREVTKITFAGRETIVAQYVQGKKTRTENLSANGSPQPVRIWNLERNTLYELDLQSQEYAERGPRSADWIVLLAQWIAPPPRIRESGKW